MGKNGNATIGAKGTEYGNWMSTAAIKMVGGIAAILVIAFVLVTILTQGIVLKIVLGILAMAGVLLLVDVLRIRKALSYDGGKAMDLMQRNLMEHLAWDGKGTALDVGCGISEVHYQGGLDGMLPKVVIRPYCIKGTAIIWGVK